MNDIMQRYWPEWMRKPNKFIRYKFRFFDRDDHSYFAKIAVYKDKNGKIKTDTAQVKFLRDCK